MKTVIWKNLDSSEKTKILSRPKLSDHININELTYKIIHSVKEHGDKVLYDYTKKYDGALLKKLTVSSNEIDSALSKLDPQKIDAINTAINRITHYHQQFLPNTKIVDTNDGIICKKLPRPIQAVGLYVPGGTAPLISTLIMLAIPAKIAKCPLKILCTPPDQNGEINPYLLYIAKLCGIDKLFKIGGAQAIAAMAFGTKTVPKVNKIYGPGNTWVTAAKLAVSKDPQGASIDLPAGPSEVMIIADHNADPSFIAADLLSQAEHGKDSQVLLVTNSPNLADSVSIEIKKILNRMSRKHIASEALSYSSIILVNNFKEAFNICNTYAPEHLILHMEEPRQYVDNIKNVGAVFLGAFTPEALGDYITGSNHVLPTYGYAKSYSGLSVTDYMTFISVQEANQEGFNKIARPTMQLADIEGLEAHKLAVSIRLEKSEIG